MAVQLRAVQTARESKVQEATNLALQEKQSENLRRKIAASAQENDKSRKQIADLRATILKRGDLSVQQTKALNAKLVELQMVSGLTAVSGAGVRITLNDNPSAAQNSDASSFLPGIVHDFDLLQLVNELRLANAEAISIKGVGQSTGTRITAYSPIRCVGPVIQVEGQPVAPPFTIEAIGNPEAIDKAVNMAGGLLYNLKDPSRGPALQVKTERLENLKIPAASSGAPHFKVAKAAS